MAVPWDGGPLGWGGRRSEGRPGKMGVLQQIYSNFSRFTHRTDNLQQILHRLNNLRLKWFSGDKSVVSSHWSNRHLPYTNHHLIIRNKYRSPATISSCWISIVRNLTQCTDHYHQVKIVRQFRTCYSSY